jgi:hypothetical protein
VPLLRGGTAHIYNNHYSGIVESGINSRAGGKAKVDNNYFEDSKDVLGTFYTSERGTWQTSGNILDNVTWSATGTDNYPAGPSMPSTTTISVPYSYQLDNASCVPSVVAKTAGANKGNQVSDGSCNAQTPSQSPSQTPSQNPTTPTTGPTDPGTSNPPGGTNLSLGAGADGSSKASGTSYGNVIDGSMSTYWSPSGTTGRVSVKWTSAKTVDTVHIREAAGAEGNIDNWQLVNNDTGAVLASGTGAGVISFTAVATTKINFVITSASGTPRVAEFEVYA